MTEEDEAFNDIERMSNIRKESVKMTMLKPKTAQEFYDELRDKALAEVRVEYEEKLDKAYGEARKIILGLRDEVASLENTVLRLKGESRRCVAEEREACAKKAEAQNCHMVAAAIRARTGEQT